MYVVWMLGDFERWWTAQDLITLLPSGRVFVIECKRGEPIARFTIGHIPTVNRPRMHRSTSSACRQRAASASSPAPGETPASRCPLLRGQDFTRKDLATLLEIVEFASAEFLLHGVEIRSPAVVVAFSPAVVQPDCHQSSLSRIDSATSSLMGFALTVMSR